MKHTFHTTPFFDGLTLDRVVTHVAPYLFGVWSLNSTRCIILNVAPLKDFPLDFHTRSQRSFKTGHIRGSEGLWELSHMHVFVAAH